MPSNPSAFHKQYTNGGHNGMTLRDWFAGQALPSIIHLCAGDTRILGESIEASFARKAYQVADAMLAEREKEATDAE